MDWVYGEPENLTEAEKGMIVTDLGMVPDSDACPLCGCDALIERGCKVICNHCRGLIQSCSE